MHLPLTTLLTLTLPLLPHAKPQPPSKNAILLSKVHTLTLHADRQTTNRRLPPLPQLTCTGPSQLICNLYKIDTMRCVNEGFDYDEEDVQWTCSASLPEEFKLGATDVLCEGFRGSEDRWVLKGSCAVEYRLLLTERGEERFGGLGSSRWRSGRGVGARLNGWLNWVGNLLFFAFMVIPIVLIFLPSLLECLGLRRRGVPDPHRRRWGGGGFWGGGPGDDGYGPPPPYSRYPGGWFDSGSSSQGWSPGFWSGALSGGSLGYGLGRRSQPYGSSRRAASRFNDYDPGEGSSRARPSFSSTTTSTGFGSTRRR